MTRGALEWAAWRAGHARRAAALVLASLVLPSTVAGAPDVSGTFSIEGGGTIAPTYAAAFERRDQRNPRQKVIEVVLSARPIDVEQASSALDPHTDVINQEALKGSDYILVWVRPNGEVSMNATFGNSMTQYIESSGERLSTQVASNGPDRVAGRLFTPTPITTLDKTTFSIDVTFSAAVARAAPGTPLPAGGGEPGKALAALGAALTTRNWTDIKAALSSDTLKAMEESYRSPEENTDYAVDVLRAWLPKQSLRVTGGEVRGDTAVLEVEGEMFPGQKGFYLTRMVKADKAWQLDRSVPIGMID